MNSIDKLIEELNKEQKEAVLNTEGPESYSCWCWFWKNKSFNNKINSYYQSKESFPQSNIVCDFYK